MDFENKKHMYIGLLVMGGGAGFLSVLIPPYFRFFTIFLLVAIFLIVIRISRRL